MVPFVWSEGGEEYEKKHSRLHTQLVWGPKRDKLWWTRKTGQLQFPVTQAASVATK